MRILITEDELAIAKALKAVLERAKYAVGLGDLDLTGRTLTGWYDATQKSASPTLSGSKTRASKTR